ncbi:hypothetical protein AXF14_05595 [Actinomyces radicidentis]|uniref:SDR-like Ig domain-containing protein n=1 Tax=Actinomyces radicidentis TaxID=111015 RepID=A0A0X8JE45_ACTRD|nr:hypothetical protein [Actinomyces radicidentis]AMD87158.1 hypothetical protein AXF14_05595 [Actinomyces radicidentis]
MSSSAPRPLTAARYDGVPRRLLALLAALAMVFSTVVAGVVAAPRASAAELAGQLTNVSVTTTKTTVTDGAFITSTINFCLPSTAVAGDTITITLPSQTQKWTRTFTVNGSSAARANTVFGEGVVDNNQSPAAATITLMDACSDLAGRGDLCVSLDLSGYVTTTQEAGTELLMDYKIGSETVTPTNPPVIVNPNPAGKDVPPVTPQKNGRFTNDGDRCQQADTKEGCLAWDITVPLVATDENGTPNDLTDDTPRVDANGNPVIADEITVTDTARSASWQWYCASTTSRVTVNTYNAAGTAHATGTQYLTATGAKDPVTYPGLVKSVS